jgi:dephospho-CoA kinase
MLRVALTGGIATGKTSVLARFRVLGVPVVQADELAHEVIAAGSEGADLVRRRFGVDLIRRDGAVDRDRLGALVFSDPQARRDLEAIVHPAVYRRIAVWFGDLAAAGARMGVAEIPLLYETARQADFDRVVVTACDGAEQVRRLRARGGLSEEAVLLRITSQMPVADKVRLADFVISTDGTLADTDRQTDEVFRALSASAGT